MKKIYLILLFAIGLFTYTNAQLLQWNTFGNAGTETTEPSVSNDPNIAAANLTFGAGVNPAANTHRFGGSNWFNTGNTNPSTLTEAIAGNDYIQFTVSPNADYSFTPTSFVFNWDKSPTGPQNVALRSSLDGYTTNLGIVAPTAAAIGTSNTITITGLAGVTTATTFRIYGYGATSTVGVGGFDIASDVINVQLNGSTAPVGIESVNNGDWFTGTTWSSGSVPGSSQNVRILHNIIGNGAINRDAGTITIVEAGASLAMRQVYTNNGTTSIRGTFQLDGGGFAGGANNFIYGSSGSLVFNNGSTYDINAGQRFWPVANAPVNVTVNTGSNANLNDGSRTISGLLNLYGGFINTAGITANGTLRINQNGYVSVQSPVYGASSLLHYNTNTNPYNNGFEWTGSTNAANVQLSSNTILNYPAIGNAARTISGNLTIDVGSALFMDYGSPAPGVAALTVTGNLVMSGSLSLGNQSGGDIKVGGNINFGLGYSFNANNRAVFFTKNGPQTISATSTPTFHYLVFEPVIGSTLVQLNGTDLNITAPDALSRVISFSGSNTDVFDINGRNLVLGTTSVSNTIFGTGFFAGTAGSNLSLLGSGNIGTINFISSFQNLGTLTLNRNSSGAVTLGTPLTIHGSLVLTNGLLILGSAPNHLTLGASASIGGIPSATNMVVADGTAELRKIYSATGSFTFPVGDNDAPDATQYSPAIVNFTSGDFTGTSYIGIKLTDAVHPQFALSTDNHITRYWSLSSSGITGSVNYNFTGTYLPADAVGSITDAWSGRWDGTNWTDGAALAANTVSVTGLTTLPFPNDFTGAKITASNHYFRSNIVAGNWNDKLSWQSSIDGITWTAATNYPTSAANTILIQTGNTININSIVSLDQTTVNGILEIQNPGTLNINDGTANDLVISNNGVLRTLGSRNYSLEVVYNGSANIHVNGGGKITVGVGSPVSGTGYESFTSGNNTWDNNAVYEWNSTSSFVINGITYFLNALSTIPVFRISAMSGLSVGGGSPTIINGLLEVNVPVTFSGGGAKTFRDGLIGTSALTLDAGLGTTRITGSNAILGGTNFSVILNKTLNIENGITIPLGAIVIVSGAQDIAKNGGNFIINGSLDITDRSISNTSGNVTINGTLKTSKTNGLYNPGNIADGTIVINNLSIVEYNATVNQAITSTSVLGQSYYNITFSGAGTKIPNNAIDVNTNGTVTITGTCAVDATTNNIASTSANSTNFTMDGGLLILGTSPGTGLPLMRGTYILTGGIVRYSGISAKTIRGANYQNIEITGTNVSNSGNVDLNAGGTFSVENGGVYTMKDNSITGVSANAQTVTVKTGGTFKTENNEGFHGFNATLTNNSSIHQNVENIILETGSIIDYSRATPGSISGDQPITNTPAISYQNLSISGTGTKTAPSTTLTVQGNLTKTGASSFAHNNGLVLLNGANQGFAGMDYYGLEMTGGSKTNNGNLTIADILKLNASTTLNITAGQTITLKSVGNKTASVGQLDLSAVINYNSTGKFMVERSLITARKWRLMAAPTSDAAQTIFTSWQEAGATPTGYGVWLVDTRPNWSPLGFDGPGFNSSVKRFNGASGAWDAVANTNVLPISTEKGYMVFVAGDRFLRTFIPATPTTLRTSGQLYIGNQTIAVPANEFATAGNPYASRIDLRLIDNSGFSNAYYIWDPSITSYYGLGAWNTFSLSGGNYVNLLGSSIYGIAGTPNNFIESGQAVMVKNATAGTSTLTFHETDKVTGSAPVVTFFTWGNPQAINLNLHLLPQDGSAPVLLDAVMANFDSANSNGIDQHDIFKMVTIGENVSWKTADSMIVIDSRFAVRDMDTLHLLMTAMRVQNYQWEINSTNMDYPGRTGFLIDRYTNTTTPLSMAGTTTYNFSIANIAGSYAADRFKIVFNQQALGPVPVTITTVTATRNQNRSIDVSWKVENETNISSYEVERSADGRIFGSIHSRAALVNNGGRAAYGYDDLLALPADNFYRIKATSLGGQLQYSAIVKVSALKQPKSISVYPNPVVDGNMQLNFAGQATGRYGIQMINAAGQVVYKSAINVGAANQTTLVSTGLAKGSYRLLISNPGGTVTALPVLLQ